MFSIVYVLERCVKWGGFLIKLIYFRNEIKCAEELFVEGEMRSTVSLRTPVLLCSRMIRAS